MASQSEAQKKFLALSSGQKDVMEQLFLQGPTWDGNIIAKQYRDELVDLCLAHHKYGWAWLSSPGVAIAIQADVKDRRDKRWYRKQQCL